MNQIHSAMRSYFSEHGEIEGVEGYYERMQNLKEMLMDSITPEVEGKLEESTKNKILLVSD